MMRHVTLSLALSSALLLTLPAPAAEPTPDTAPAESTPENTPVAPADSDDAANDAESEAAAQSGLPLEDIQALAQVFERIKQAYVDDVDDKTLLRNAMRGMLEGLDPHSNYLDEDAFRTLHEMTEGEFGGIGIEVGQEDNQLMVISPIDNTPASKAGLQPRDLIIEIDGKSTDGMSLEEAVDMMRGDPGSKIDLTLLREGAEAPINVSLERDNIQAASVNSRMLSPGYGYLRISQFQENTAEETGKAIAALKKQAGDDGLSGVVLDLRNNPGGLLEGAVNVADLFLDSGLVVYTKGRLKDSDMQFEANAETALPKPPMVVLINGGSASAAEIVAGALQDHHRAVVLGTESFGKGSVQSVMPLDDTTGIKLTTALYYTPGGRSIQAEGIEPDVTVQRGRLELEKGGFEIREANLRGHLQNARGESEQDKAALPDSPVAADDYQLGEALNLLRGINVFQQPGMRRHDNQASPDDQAPGDDNHSNGDSVPADDTPDDTTP
ncbi:S41 family peptidase [uncultured Kushneria sp.]|uniref:S41 family peptidase n=1 Tax=uncultured Kushneria sp. TaxID=905033 RepID=UPI0026099B5D|nr:S41 family peptidase [uncultured Kushneria sp.]